MDIHSHDFRLPVLVTCDRALLSRVRYVLDTLCMAAGLLVDYVDTPPSSGAWLYYGDRRLIDGMTLRCVTVVHAPAAWAAFDSLDAGTEVGSINGAAVLFAQGADPVADVGFDLAANAFYFLSSWAERREGATGQLRHLYATCVAARRKLPQDIVDQYVRVLTDCIAGLCTRLGMPIELRHAWPTGASHAVVLSHDVDFLPVRPWDNALQGAKTVARHLLRHHDPRDAFLSLRGLGAALMHGRDPYGCVPEIIARERALGVRSSFQVAVGHRHPSDVNYRIEDDRVRDYLRAILDAGFDLCLHGSVRATEDLAWYVAEAALLTERLARPIGSRQHFLSFDHDALFSAQEAVGIRYDMSVGYADRPGPRAGLSFPYFPYNLRDDRPYNVVQIPLLLMDVTLRSYMNLRAAAAQPIIDAVLGDVRSKRGCGSVVWHPIVFGGARDPGYDTLYWRLVEQTLAKGGLATDGQAIDLHWRGRARAYASFASLAV